MSLLPSCRLIVIVVAVVSMPLGPKAATAEVKLPNILSDHAVFQRNRPIHIWGTASPTALVTIKFHTQRLRATADDGGIWSCWLSPENAGGPFNLVVTGDGEVTLKDILVGDVWLASGQSNMQMPLKGFDDAPVKDSAAILATATFPRIHLLQISRRQAKNPALDIVDRWTVCTPETAALFSAIAYLFGRDISQHEKIPVGLIDASWGGSPVEAWTSQNTMNGDPALTGSELRADPIWQPSVIFNGMIAPLTYYSVKGFLWYQGESNSSPAARAKDYAVQLPALIADWRMHFAQGRLPFLFVQISSFSSVNASWGIIRDAQRRTLDVANTAMVVTLDVGDRSNVHPPDKETVANRLSLAARALVYGESIKYEGPSLRQVTAEGARMRVWLNHAEGLTNRGRPVANFEIAGPDHLFQQANAKLEGETVVIDSSNVSNPVYVRYGWANDAVPSLYNSAKLPLSTFTSEDHPQP